MSDSIEKCIEKLAEVLGKAVSECDCHASEGDAGCCEDGCCEEGETGGVRTSVRKLGPIALVVCVCDGASAGASAGTGCC